jgi:hypothetical protein
VGYMLRNRIRKSPILVYGTVHIREWLGDVYDGGAQALNSRLHAS